MTPLPSDPAHMDHALRLAARGLGRVWPNPAVGCVLVRDGRVVGRGWTRPGGRPHAERVALDAAGDAARGATAFVTLEPCAHHGATPPCAEALVAAGLGRVVAAMGDPDPRVSGRGLARLRAAGIAVVEGVRAAEAQRLNRGFLTRLALGRPMLTLKLAASLDGRIATAAGESRWITGEAARARVHAMRMGHDAVLVGGGTARADDPALDVRGLGRVGQPVRIVASATLDLPAGGRLAAGSGGLWLLHGAAAPSAAQDRWRALGARLIPCGTGADGALDPASALLELGAAGLTRVLCEGGGRFGAALLAAGLVDEIALFSAGVALGAEGRAALGPLPAGPLGAMPRYRLDGLERLGEDVLTLWSR